MVDKKEKKGLGRGLSALMADIEPVATTTEVSSTPSGTTYLPIEKVEANPDQPRKTFDEEDLKDLRASILEKGIIQPLIVRLKPGSTDIYQIVAGERRWRAAQMAKIHDVPVVIRDLSDTDVLEIAIIENIQRADLNAIEEAQGYRQLQDKYGHTQEQLSQALGKSRSHIANLMRLLSLPEDVLQLVREQRLSAGHARTLINAPNASELARKIVNDGLSVRQAEKLAKTGADQPSVGAKPKSAADEKDADTVALERDLRAATGMNISISHDSGKESGMVQIKYKTLEELDQLCGALSGIK